MVLTEKSQVKFTKCERTGDLIGFVSRNAKTKKLKGVREDSEFGKQVCVLSSHLQGTLIPNLLYDVELKAMHRKNGFVVISATPVLFKAQIELVVIPKITYQIKVIFGNKVIYFDPKDGKTASSKTLEGVLKILSERKDVENLDEVITDFSKKAMTLIRQMQADGFFFK